MIKKLINNCRAKYYQRQLDHLNHNMLAYGAYSIDYYSEKKEYLERKIKHLKTA